MIYHTHLQMFTPSAATTKIASKPKNQEIQKSYSFKKNLYSPEIIKWILEQIESKKMSVSQIIDRYSIPRTTIYRWKKKYAK
ncbi:MAG: helix-turn-helix domain-containing protein [Flavobacteriales bacterium]|nr:helix-turn-helix domain-containing protein [Flavobacteriales bacterium]